MADAKSTASGSTHRVQVPKFLIKTFNMLESEKYKEYVSWNEAGDSLVVLEQHGFTDIVLPAFFKHSNFASFVRQLNMYGFRRVEDKIITFQHPLFIRGKKENLALIKRKVSHKESSETGQKELKLVLKEMKELQDKQKLYDEEVAKLKVMNSHLENENSMMWDALNRAKQRQNLLASKMQKIMMFLYKAYRNPTKQLSNEPGVPMIEDTTTGGRDLPSTSADALERAESIIGHLKSSDQLLSSVDAPTDGNDENGAGKPKIEEPNDDSSSYFDPNKRSDSLQLFGSPTELSRDHSLALNNLLSPGSGQMPGSLENALKTSSAKNNDNYLGLARDMDQHLANQDNTLHRLNTVESMMDDPLDNFIEYTSPSQIGSLLDLDESGNGVDLDFGSEPKRKKAKTEK